MFGKTPHSDFLVLRERERREEESISFSFRSSEFHRSEFVEPKEKVHLLDERYAWVPKMRGFTEDLEEEISGNQGFRTKEASYPCYHAQRGEYPSYCGLLPL